MMAGSRLSPLLWRTIGMANANNKKRLNQEIYVNVTASQPSLKDPRQCVGSFVKDMPHTKGSVTGPTCFKSRCRCSKSTGASRPLTSTVSHARKSLQVLWWQEMVQLSAVSRSSYFGWACGCFDISIHSIWCLAPCIHSKHSQSSVKGLLQLQCRVSPAAFPLGKLAIKVQPWKAELRKDLGCSPVKLCGSNLPLGSDWSETASLQSWRHPSGNDLQKISISFLIASVFHGRNPAPVDILFHSFPLFNCS